MKTIPLTQGQVALVDDDDYSALAAHKWRALCNSHARTFYAVRHSYSVNGKRMTILMHQVIMGTHPGQQVDHINHDGLDNRRYNLRLADAHTNQQNARKRSGCSSPEKGVSWHKRARKWQARICDGELLPNGRRRLRHLGYFATEAEASAAYTEAARISFEEFACTDSHQKLRTAGHALWRG
jgi:hypothetical protein